MNQDKYKKFIDDIKNKLHKYKTDFEIPYDIHLNDDCSILIINDQEYKTNLSDDKFHNEVASLKSSGYSEYGIDVLMEIEYYYPLLSILHKGLAPYLGVEEDQVSRTLLKNILYKQHKNCIKN